MKFKVRDIAAHLSGEIEGNTDAEVENIADIENAKKGDLTFLSNPKYESFLYETEASAAIVSRELVLKGPVSTTLIRVEDPYGSFTQVLEMVEKTVVSPKVGIEQPSYVDETATIGNDVYIGAFAYVGKGAVIGDNVKIYPNCYVGDGVEIQEHTTLYPGASAHYGVKIGAHCTLHHGAVVGSDGFGFAPQADGTYRRIPQLGTVILEDHVSIGANTAVDRATFDATVIKRGTKLDNLIQVAHNCSIGENTVMAAQVGLAGTTQVGANCMFGGQVGVGGHLQIADGSKIGPMAGVMSSIKEADKSWVGAPIMDPKEFFRMTASMRKLPDLIKRVRDLEKQLEEQKGE